MNKIDKKYWSEKIKDNKDKSILEEILNSNEELDHFDDFINVQEASEELVNWKKFDKEVAWNKVQPKSKFKLSFVKYAAVILLILGVSFYSGVFNSEDVYIADSSDLHILLDDGSDIVLYPGAELRILSGFNQSNRNVEFKGKAYFNIAKDAQKPFGIKMENGDVKVLGTVFYIDEKNESLIVDLISGRVELSNNKGDLKVLSSGNSATILNEDIEVSKGSEIEHNSIDDLYFDNIMIKDAIDRLNEVYGKNIIELEDKSSELASKPIHTTVKNASVREFIKSLKVIFNVKIVNSKGKFTIST